MQKKLALVLFFIAVMMSVIGFSELQRADAARGFTPLYDGDVEQLISDMKREGKMFGFVARAKEYYTEKYSRTKHCIVYIDSSRDNYIDFPLYSDNSVVSATFYMKENRSNSRNDKIGTRLGAGLALFLKAIGMTDQEGGELIAPLGEIDEKYGNAPYIMGTVIYVSSAYCARQKRTIYLKISLTNTDEKYVVTTTKPSLS